jgi:two-component system OmpR family response regulator
MSAAKARRILVIDDSEVMLERIESALSAAGYEVIATTQGVGNARHLRSCDLIIIDYHMPGIGGQTVVSSLRAASRDQPLCPLFLYTSDEKAVTNYGELGFDGVLKAKGDQEALVRQVTALFRTLDMRAEKLRKES